MFHVEHSCNHEIQLHGMYLNLFISYVIIV